MGARPSTPQAGRSRADTLPNGGMERSSNSIHSVHGSSGASSSFRRFNSSSSGPHGPTSSGVEPSTGNSRLNTRRGRSMSAVETPTSGSSHYGRGHASDSDSDDSSGDGDDVMYQGVFRFPGSLPIRLLQLTGQKCPVCGKQLASDRVESHLLDCLTKPRLIYNEDILTEAKGECVICLEEMDAGHTIARLPCLCVYHKRCIDSWFRVNRSCPEHPAD